MISSGGGGQPQWRGNGKELFYVAADGSMMSVKLTGESLIPGIPEPLFKTGLSVAGGLDNYAASRDGQRFLIVKPLGSEQISSIAVVINWFEEIKERFSAQ